MSVLLLRLNQVPEDEADQLRDLLRANDIQFYETSAGVFGLSMAGIWLADRAQLPQAQALVEDYNQKRAIAQRQEYETRRARGELENFWQRLRRQPMKVLLCLAAIAVIAYLSIAPFYKGLE